MSHPWKFGDVLERGRYEAPYHKTMRVMVIEPFESKSAGLHARVIFLRHEGPLHSITRVGDISVVSGWVKAEE